MNPIANFFRLSVHIASIELRKIFAYRVDFWVGFFGGVIVELAVAYYLWSNVFSDRGTTQIMDYSFLALMLHYFCVSLVTQLTHGQNMHVIAEEIYQGGLTRYLLYPVSFFWFQLLGRFAFFIVASAQLILGLLLFAGIWGFPAGVTFNFSTGIELVSACLVGMCLYFFIEACLDMVAFWADHVWSLTVVLRITTRLLGGCIVPIVFFPASAQPWLKWLPFYGIIGFPTRIITTGISFDEFYQQISISIIWLLFFMMLARLVWSKGRIQYTGVGI